MSNIQLPGYSVTSNTGSLQLPGTLYDGSTDVGAKQKIWVPTRKVWTKQPQHQTFCPYNHYVAINAANTRYPSYDGLYTSKNNEIVVNQCLTISPTIYKRNTESFCIIARIIASGERTSGVWRTNLGGSTFCLIQTNGYPWIRSNGVDVLKPTSGTTALSSALRTVAFVFSPGRYEFWSEGKLLHSSTNSTPIESNLNFYVVGAQFTYAEYSSPSMFVALEGINYDFGSLTTNPWQLFAPRKQQIPVFQVPSKYSIIKKPNTRQPQTACVDFSHPLAPKNGFVIACVGGILKLFTAKNASGLLLGHKIKPSPAGEGFGLDTINDAVSPVFSTFPIPIIPSKGSTILFQAYRAGTFATAERIFEVSIGSYSLSIFWSGGWVYAVPFAAGNCQFSIDNSPQLGVVCAVQHNGSNLSNGLAWINGERASTTSVATASGSITDYTNYPMYVANRSTSGRGFLGAIQFIYYDNAVRSEAEIAQLSQNPWQIFKSRNYLAVYSVVTALNQYQAKIYRSGVWASVPIKRYNGTQWVSIVARPSV